MLLEELSELELDRFGGRLLRVQAVGQVDEVYFEDQHDARMCTEEKQTIQTGHSVESELARLA